MNHYSRRDCPGDFLFLYFFSFKPTPGRNMSAYFSISFRSVTLNN